MARRILASAGATLSLALAAVVFSELWFWGRWRAEDSVLGLAETVVAYAAVVQVCRLVAARTAVSVNSWRRVFLVGLLFGWLVEGVVVTTVIDDLPLTIAWTGMAWHALFTVLLGWWWVPRMLTSRRWMLALAAVGAGVGAWAAFWRFEDAPGIPTPFEFALYATVTTALYAAGLAGWWALRRGGTPSVRGSLVAILALTALAVVHAMAAPLTLIGPALALLAVLAIALTGREPGPAFLSEGPAPWRSLWRLVVIPAVASLVYTVFALLPEPVPTGWAFLVVGVGVSVVLTVIALVPPRARSE